MARTIKRTRGIRAGRVEVEGLDELIRDMETLGREARPALRKGMRTALNVVAKEARENLRKKEASGKVYRVTRGGKTTVHRASAPGQTPAKLFGLLAKSIKVTVAKSGLAGRVLSADPKAHVQEYGSVNQEERPFLRPALAKKRDEVLRILEAAFRAGMSRVFRRKK